MEDNKNNNIIYLIQSRKINEESVVHGWTFNKEDAKQTINDLAMTAYKIELGVNLLENIDSPLKDTVPIEQISYGTTIRWSDSKKEEHINLFKITKISNFMWVTRKDISILESFFITPINHISLVEKNAKNSSPKKSEPIEIISKKNESMDLQN
jgi:hypothetical protein